VATTYFVDHQAGTYKAYKTIGGWSIMFLDEKGNSRPADMGKVYKHRQGAYRRMRQLNEALGERIKQMINHEIYIIGFDGDLGEVNIALANAGIQTNPGEAEAQGKESSVYVCPDQIGQAVQIINGLGYETDEDE
jgi:hypothetical protein